MAPSPNQLIIHVSPDAISISIFKNGRATQTEQVALNILDWAAVWADGLMQLDQPTRQLLSRFGNRKFPTATVIYNSPTVTQQIHTSDLKIASAGEAGEIKMRESIGFTNPVEYSTLDDSVGRGGKTTTLVYSDREENLRSLFAWLNRCGLKAQAFIPMSVGAVEVAAEIAVQTNPDTAVFYMGPDTSIMAFSNDSGIQLIRSAEIGYRKLIEGYAQGLKVAANEAEALNAEVGSDQETCQDKQFNEEAVSYLFKYGIPFKSIDVDGIDLRASILPILAPVLQRFCIEIKQTFRFGLGEVELPKNLMICGPGASIDHMGGAIAQHIDMHVQVSPESKDFNVGCAFGDGTVELGIASMDKQPVGLLPMIARESMMKSKLNRSLIAGVALASLALGGEYFHTSIEQNRVSKLIENDAHRLQTVQEFKQQLASVGTMSSLINDVSHLVSETVEGVPNWHQTLVPLSEVTTDSIHLQEIRGDYSSKNPIIEINGYAIAQSGETSGVALNAFINDIKSIDEVIGVTLGATSRISIGEEKWGRQFTMKLHLDINELPHKQLAGTLTKMNEWGTP